MQRRKGKHIGRASSGVQMNYGKYGIRVIEAGQISAKQIQSVKKVILKEMQHNGKVWLKIFPDIPRTAKPKETRMGKGKGKLSFWVLKVRPGQILFEIDGAFSELYAKNILRKAICKLSLKNIFSKNLFC